MIADLKKIAQLSEKHLDTLALMTVVLGSFSAALAMSADSSGVVILNSPFHLKMGLAGIAIGSLVQLGDNLWNTHKVRGKSFFWIVIPLFIILMILSIGA